MLSRHLRVHIPVSLALAFPRATWLGPGLLFLSMEAALISNSPAPSRLCGRKAAEGSSPLGEPMSAALVWETLPGQGTGTVRDRKGVRLLHSCTGREWGIFRHEKAPLPRPGGTATPSFPGCHGSSRLPLAVLVLPSPSWSPCPAEGWGGKSTLPGPGWVESGAKKGL